MKQHIEERERDDLQAEAVNSVGNQHLKSQ